MVSGITSAVTISSGLTVQDLLMFSFCLLCKDQTWVSFDASVHTHFDSSVHNGIVCSQRGGRSLLNLLSCF